tara:strand:- start:7138 stop:8085 length:948 start_codon:yes stop_codon:yes gene_type:complete
MKSYRQILTYNSEIGYKFLPNMNFTVVGDTEDNMIDYIIKTDSLGYRNEKDIIKIDNFEKKIDINLLYLGCSFTAGDGVDNSSRFTDLIGDNFYNCALPGSCFIQQTLAAIECSKYINTKKIIFMPHLGCIVRNLSKERSNIFFQSRQIWHKPLVSFMNSELFFTGIPVKKPTLEFIKNNKNEENKYFLKTYFKKLKKFITYNSEYLKSWDREFKSNYQLKLVSALYQKVKEVFPNAKFIIAPIPTKLFLDKSTKNSKENSEKFFIKVSRSINAEYIDIARIISSENYSKYFYNEGHLNRSGHRRFASLIKKIIN